MSSRIYTRTGDRGETGLFGGGRVPKNDPRIEACGSADELNAVMGVAASCCEIAEIGDVLVSIQNDLFQLGADLATPASEETSRGAVTVRRIEADNVLRLEALIDRWDAELPPLRNFILPGGHPLAACLHQARAVCRRAERRYLTLRQTQGPAESDPPDHILTFLNRLSDLLFVLSRAANARNSVPDVPWRS